MAKKAPIDACKLCLRTRELRLSHIVSDLFWKGSGIFKSLKYVNLEPLIGTGAPIRNQQGGFKMHLLCDECEGRLNKWETYIRPLFFGDASPFIHPPTTPAFIAGSIDYKMFKLLTMSVLWRMAISGHPYYANVRIGERKREQLRKLLLNETPGNPLFYGCAFSVLVNANDGTTLRGMLSPPIRLASPVNGNPSVSYGFIIAGVHWHMFIGEAVCNRTMQNFFIKPNGDLRVRIAHRWDFPYLKPLFDEAANRVFPSASLRT